MWLKKGLELNLRNLSIDLGVKVIPTNSRAGNGLTEIKQAIAENSRASNSLFFDPEKFCQKALQKVKNKHHIENNYIGFQYLQQASNVQFLDKVEKEFIQSTIVDHELDLTELQRLETANRYDKIKQIIDRNLKRYKAKTQVNQKIDRIINHPIFGYTIFLGILMLIFPSDFCMGRMANGNDRKWNGQLIRNDKVSIARWYHK